MNTEVPKQDRHELLDLVPYGALLLPREMSCDLELKYVRDVECFDGLMLLGEFVDVAGQPWLYHWCDCDREKVLDRWAVVRTTKERLAAYERNEIPLLDMLLNTEESGVVTFVDLAGNGEPVAVWFVAKEHYPSGYLPARPAWHSKEDQVPR